jgi:heme-degrading monooxygenase HmoA
MKSLPVHESAFTVLVVFNCNPGESERFAHELADFNEARMRRHPGFLSAMVYLSEDARRVIEVFQWARSEDWEAYRGSEDGRKAVEHLAGRSPKIEFLELVRAVGVLPPGDGAPATPRPDTGTG